MQGIFSKWNNDTSIARISQSEALAAGNTVLVLVIKKLHITSSPAYYLKAISTTTAKNAYASSFRLPQVHLTFVRARNQLEEIKRKLNKTNQNHVFRCQRLQEDFHAEHSKNSVISSTTRISVPNSTPRKNKSKLKHHKKPMYPESMQPSSSLDSLSFDLEGFQILALLIYSSVVMYSSQTWIDTAASLSSICHHNRAQCKIPMNQIQHIFYGNI